MENDGASPETWPDFELPSDVPRDESTTEGQPNSTTAAAPVTPATPPAQPPAATPPAPTGGAPAATPQVGDDVIPKHRLDETIAERDRYRALAESNAQQLATLTGIVQRLQAGGTPPAGDPQTPPAAAPLSPQDQQVRDRLLQVVPELGQLPQLLDLLSKKDDLLAAANDSGRWRQNEQAITDRFVQSSVDTVFDKVAAFTLGEGKKGTDLNPLVQQSVVAAFSRFVASDPARSARYEQHDGALVDEFWNAYKAVAYDPIRRDANAHLLERAGSPPAVPIGGSQQAPSPPAPKTPDGSDEDAIHGSAWARRGEFTGASR